MITYCELEKNTHFYKYGNDTHLGYKDSSM